MTFTSHGRLLYAVACVVWWSYVPLTAAQDDNTTGSSVWPDYTNYSKPTTSNSYVYFTAIPFPYYECKTISITIYSNGYLSFGSGYNRAEPPPPAEWPYTPKLLAMYWSKLTPDTFKATSSMYIGYDDNRLKNVTYDNSLIQYVKRLVAEPDFEPLAILTATWENITPTTNDNDTATFQVLLATDSQVTYAIRGYQSVWTSREFTNVTYYAATYSQGYGDRPKLVLPDSKAGPEVIRLGAKKANKDAHSCVETTQAVVARLNASLILLPPCPCFEVQALRDPQFKTQTTPHCYQSVNPPQGGSLLQLCCYNMYGHLVNYTREMRVPVPTDPSDRSLQEANEKCCAVGSGLCEWFQYKIYKTKCVDYIPAFNKTELPSFNNKEDAVVYDRNTNSSVELSVNNNTRVTYSLMTPLSSSHGLSLSGNIFSWNIASALNELRKASYPQRLVIYATDANNMSASFAPVYKLCLCQDSKQCNPNSLAISVTRDTHGMDTFTGLDSYERGNVNVMACDCKGNGTGRFCEKPITACDNCVVQNTPGCSSNPPDYCPTCPVGYQRSGTQCVGPVLWPDYVKTRGMTLIGTYGYLTEIPFTYFECKTNEIQIYSEGYISFGYNYYRSEPPPPAEWPYYPKLLGMYWSKLTKNTYDDKSRVYINYDSNRLDSVTYDNSLIQYIKNTVGEPDFEPLAIISVTRENLIPNPNSNDTATFQVLLATDSQVTYAIRGYTSVWKSPELANVTYYAATYSQGNGQRPKIVIPGSLSAPEVIRLGTKQPTKDPYTCVANTQAIVARLNTSLNVLPPCPCYEVQASSDQQFTVSNSSTQCYQSRNLPPGGSLYQQCCYNMYGHLVNYTKEAGKPVPTDPSDRSLQEANEKCCADGSGLCYWFHWRIYRTKCINYMPAFNKSVLPTFINSMNDVVYNADTNYGLGLSVVSSTGVKYSMVTSFNSSHGITLTDNSLTWMIASALTELRNASYPKLLVIYATDANKMSGAYAPLYKLCLCQDSSQCRNILSVQLSIPSYGMNTFVGLDSYKYGNVNVLPCDCKGNGTGKFCEKPINTCDNCVVQNASECSSNPQDYCPTCPAGYQRSGTQCIGRTIAFVPPGNSGHKTEDVYLPIVLCLITSLSMLVQNLLATHM